MSNLKITILSPADCSAEQLKEFLEMVISGRQVQEQGLEERVKRAALLGFGHIDGKLAGVASIKNQKRSYVIGRFLKAKVPRLADSYDHEIGYAVTGKDFRRMGVSISLLKDLMASLPKAKFYATTKNDDMRKLLEKLGFSKKGMSYHNQDGETLDLYAL